MKLLQSKKLKLPHVYFITNREEIKDIPIGIPFIYGHWKDEKYLVRILEYEVLYQAAIKSGYSFNFKKILKDEGFTDIEDFNYTFGTAPIIDFSSEGWDYDVEVDKGYSLTKNTKLFKDYVRDSSAYVDVTKLKELNVFPIWLDTIEKAIDTNIHNFAVFNSNMYNKKLEGMFGGLELTSPGKNLIIIDISGSIPKAVSSTCLTLAKSLADSFYADLLITGSKSILYQYEEIHTLDIKTIYEMGMNNDQKYFKELLTSDERSYKTVIVFGDNDHPGFQWGSGDSQISDEDGKKLCKWKISHLISFHTKNTERLAGYARWFKAESEERIENWVKYLN